MSATADQILERLRLLANPANLAGMARYGINPHNTLGVSIPAVRDIARQAGKDHALAEALWSSGIHEARILAALVDIPKQVSEAQMERWAMDFDSWDVCDQVCSNLFDRTPYAYSKALEWSQRPEEFVRRAAFALMASLASHDKKAPDERFEQFFPAILAAADDERNFVKKAVNWALRGIGKRSLSLNQKAVRLAEQMRQIDSKAARWNAADALRELTGEQVQARLRQRG